METLKEFKGIFWVQDIMVYTDHKYLEKKGLGTLSDRVHLWALLLEEFTPRIEYIKGNNTLVADVISCLE